MAKLAWDRTLETILNKNCNALLVAGSPLLLRDAVGLRAYKVPPLSSDDLSSMIDQVMPASDEVENVAGHVRFEITYGEKDRFRVAALGYPDSTAIVLNRVIDEAPEPPAQSPPWNSSGTPKSWSQIFHRCLAYGATRVDAILAAGCPPLLWSDAMVHAAYAPPLTQEVLSGMVGEIRPTTGTCEKDGYLGFTIRFRNKDVFRFAVFGAPEPKLALAMRVGPELADAQ